MRLLSISFLLGILCIQQFQTLSWGLVLLPNLNLLSPYMVMFIVLLLFLALVLTINYFWRYRLLTGFIVGFFYAFWASTTAIDSRLSAELEGEDIIVVGTIASIPQQRKNGWSFRLNIEKASRLGEAGKQLPLKGTIRLGWYRTKQIIHADEKWQMLVRLKRPAGFMNPGGFDYEKWLFQQGIIATGYVRKSTDNRRSTKAPFYSVNALRESILRTIQQRIENPELAAIVSALAVADRAGITDQQWDTLRQTGTNHLIAISGLHIGMVAGFGFFPIMLIWWLFPTLYLKMPVRIAGGIAGAGLAILYALLAGFTLPTQRALIMVLVVLFGLLARKHYSSSSILATALMAVLLYDPLAVLSQGFWLSFVAVGLIMFTVARRISRPRLLVVDLITIQFALSLGMLPLTLALFGTGSLSSPVANLLAIPWVTLVVVPLTLLGVLLIPLATISSFLLNLAATSVDNMMQVLELLSSPQTMISIPEIPAYLLMLSFIGFLWLWLPSKFPGRWLGLILLLPLVISRSEPLEEGSFKFHLLDVGQGLASVVQTKNHVLVFDTGPRASSSFDTGKLVVLPFLRSENIKHIDTLLISHEDLDHRGGAAIILNTLTVDRVLSSDPSIFPNTEHCDKGMKWQWDGVVFEMLHPEKNWQGSDNDRSCVLRVSNNYHSLLLTGDIQKRAERQLLDTDSKLKSDVMVVPHHGSKTSSSERYLDAVKPELALAALGYRNRFHFPNKAIIKRYKKRGIRMLTTVENGAIRIDFPANNDAFQVESYRKKHQYYWNKKSIP